MKICNKCNTSKNVTEFGKHKRSGDGLQTWCKLCTNNYFNEWRKINKEKSSKVERKSFTKFYSTVHGRAVHMHNNAKNRARRNGVQFSLDIEWIENILSEGICQVTGIPFVYQINNGKGHANNSFSPSLDRINQSGDYSPDNCQIVCWIYNRAKGAFPIDDLYTMITALSNQR